MNSTTIDVSPDRKAPPRWRADLALALVAFVWGSTFVVVKSALSDISTVYFLALRFGVASLCMVALFATRFRQAGWRAVASGLRGGALAGLFLWSGYVLQTYGLKYTTAGKSGFITGLYVVLVPVLSALIYRRVPQKSELAGIAVASVGLVLLTLPTLDFRMNVGDLLTIGCAVAFALHLLVLWYYSQREQFEAVALGQILSAALLSALALWVEPARALWSGSVIFALVLTSVFATALAFAFYTWAQKYTSATRTALIFALEPVFALATAVILGGESLSARGLVGAALILGGILVVELKPITRS
ncbi:MAG: DMT family transporter [Bryobacteraceae bacterium]